MTADGGPAGSPIAPVHGSSRGPSPGFVLVAVLAALITAIVVAVVSAPLPDLPRPSALAVASPSPSVATTPVASPSSAVSPGPPVADARTVVVLRGVTDPGEALGTLAGCTPLLRVTGQATPAIKGSDVDATAVAAGRETGWIFVPPGIQAVTRVWLGDNVVELARAAGRPVVAVGTNGDVWLGGPAGAARWRPISTPAGRTAWVLTADEVTSRGQCGPWPVPATIAGQRSLTCAGLGVQACLQLVARVAADEPAIPYPRGDMAVALPDCLPQTLACGLGQATVAAVPVGWTGDVASVLAATRVSADGAFMLLAGGAEPDYALDAISRPTLPLPTGATAPTARACTGTLIGDLRAAAWDPRVVWVGAIGVVWPPGTSARFADAASLTVPRPSGSYRFVAGAPVEVQGSLDPRSHAFVACTVRPGSPSVGQ